VLVHCAWASVTRRGLCCRLRRERSMLLLQLREGRGEARDLLLEPGNFARQVRLFCAAAHRVVALKQFDGAKPRF